MSVSLAERFVCRFLRSQQMTNAPANRPEANTEPTAIPAITPAARTVDLRSSDADVGEVVALLFPEEVVSFIVATPGGGIWGGEVLTFGLSAHSSPTITSRVSVVALACQIVHVSASRSTMMYTAEKKGLPIIETSFTLTLDVGAINIPGAEESVLKEPSDATYSWGKIRISLDSLNCEVPSNTRVKSPPYLRLSAFSLSACCKKEGTYCPSGLYAGISHGRSEGVVSAEVPV